MRFCDEKNFDLRTFLVDTLYFIGGSVLYSLGLYTFALHAGFATGGISGIALILNRFFNWPLGLVSLALNVPLILLSFKVVGRTFMVKSIWTMLINSFFLDVVFPRLPAYTGSPLLAAMFTGVFLGGGLALVYMRGSSTGGTDFITMVIKKMRPHVSIGRIVLVTDIIIILAGGLAFGNVDAVLYGIITSFATTMVIDNLLYGAGSSKLAIIVTNFGKQTAKAISDEVGRGATLLKAQGAYTGKDRDLLLCACSKSEIYKVRMAARLIDPDSIVMIAEASEVFGEGFVPPMLPGNEDPHQGKNNAQNNSK